MTGYGKAVVEFKDRKVCIEAKSLNSKALDLSVRLAPVYREKEMDVRQRLSRALSRGKVDLSVWIERDAAAEATPVNGELLQAYYRRLREIARETGVPEPQDWFPLLVRLPDVMAKAEAQGLEEGEWERVSRGIDDAVGELVGFRAQEGAALERKFEEKLRNLSSLLESLGPLEASRIERIRARIVEGLGAIPEVDYDRGRLEQELIYYIEKLDISEEKQRLANHIAYFRQTMAEGSAQGRKLGFISQEMGREINTTGSKSNQAEMQNIVVRMKDELEQIKEQVLNVL